MRLRGKSGDVWSGVLVACLSGWFGLTVLSQHPHPAFDRFRRFDVTGLAIGNWRFFAPEPAQHDFHILYRVLTVDGAPSAWALSAEIPERSWVQAVWFPDRRADKALFDVCHELIGHLGTAVDLTATTAYRVLRDSVELRVRTEHPGAKGFQFVIARSAGYDETPEPEYLLVSPFVAVPTSRKGTVPA
jgi:hypothetical protein